MDGSLAGGCSRFLAVFDLRRRSEKANDDDKAPKNFPSVAGRDQDPKQWALFSQRLKASPARFDVIKPMDDALTEPLCNNGTALARAGLQAIVQ